MKDIWRERYRESAELNTFSFSKILTGFNINIDRYYSSEDLQLELEEVEAEELQEVESRSDLRKLLKLCIEKGENHEVKKSFDPGFDADYRRELGGQGGIFANFLSRIGVPTVFYTSMLSQELAELLDEGIEHPVSGESLLMTRPRDAVNTDQTKENTIIEFEGDRTGRLILSDDLKGFGPYFRQGVEEDFKLLEEEVDRAVLSGFHDADGNFEAKIEKAKRQMGKLDVLKHLEYTNMEREKSVKILADLLQEFESIGLDEEEACEVAERFGVSHSGKMSLGEAFKLGKTLIEKKNLSRCHIHTYRYHVVVVEDEYEVESQKIRESMLFGENCALMVADTGRLPKERDVRNYSLKEKHVHVLDELEDFAHHLNLEEFPETGMADLEGFRIVAIPTLVHEDPERLTGMGDVISCGAFAAESR